MKRILFVFLLVLSCGALWAQQSDDEKLALQYYKDKEFDKAITLFEKIQNQKPNSYIYYYYYASLMELERYSDLEKLTKKQIKAFPNVQRYKVDQGYVYERSGDNAKAEKIYQDLIKNLPAKEFSVQELYSAFYSRAKYEYAIETILKGRKMLNNSNLLSKELLSIYQHLNQTDRIIEEVLSLVKDDNSANLEPAQNALQNLLLDDEDNQKYLAVKGTLQKYSQKSPDNICYLMLLSWINQLHKEYGEALILAKAIDKRQKTECIRTYDLACVAADNHDYATAIEALEYIISKGESVHNYVQAKMKVLDVRYLQLTETYPVKMVDAINLERDFKKVLDENGMHSGTADWIRKYAHLLAFYVNKPQEAVNVLTEAMNNATRDQQEKNQFKIDLADVQLYMGNVWDATLNYSQVNKDMPNDDLGNEAKFKNAKLSFYIGEFDWAKSQLDVLSSATTKLIANDAIYFSLLISDNQEEEEEDDGEKEDTTYLLFEKPSTNMPLLKYAEADFLIFQNKDDKALEKLDSVIALAPFGTLVDDALYQKALIFIKRKDYLGAETLLKNIIENHGTELLADDAVFKLAELYEYYIKDIPKAMEYYQKILKDHSGSLFVVEARKRYRALRGDNVE
ncbi:MAG: tetratricopeptide repeat protein [Bacteroidales bacterium]|nr:tetratricopeptide repeat protein [Bacteroidales bacterium]